jgi:copper(I)-binding protein
MHTMTIPARRLMLAACLLPGLAAAAGPGVSVSDPWARATPPHAGTGAVYMSLTSPTDDRLTGCTTPAAKAAQLHETTQTAAGVMQMRPIDGLDLPAGKTVTLSPEKYHVMLTGLKAPLVAGKTVKLHLTFAHAAPVDVTVPILAAGADAPDMAGMKM